MNPAVEFDLTPTPLAPALLALALVLAGFSSAAPAQTAKKATPAIRTGPEIGAKIPSFEALDQHGRRQRFETLRGPKGLLLLFSRSADW